MVFAIFNDHNARGEGNVLPFSRTFGSNLQKFQDWEKVSPTLTQLKEKNSSQPQEKESIQVPQIIESDSPPQPPEQQEKKSGQGSQIVDSPEPSLLAEEVEIKEKESVPQTTPESVEKSENNPNSKTEETEEN